MFSGIRGVWLESSVCIVELTLSLILESPWAPTPHPQLEK
nr:MAG TPA: hypothetical protein [Caudoviricetes sp.]